MNRTHSLVWNDRQQRHVVAPESARSRGKRSGGSALKPIAGLLAALFGGFGGMAIAADLPTGAKITAGNAQIATNGNTMTVNQSSKQLITNWQSFNIGANNTVQFVQPSSSAVALNRVVGNEASGIYGKLQANGQVYLVNPNGVLFGKSAQVDVGGLVASTLNISDNDFLAGKRTFTASGGALLKNEGQITAAEGGSIALLGTQVSNTGTLTARLGSVAMGAGDRITLSFAGNRLTDLQVDAAALNALVDNRNAIIADGGVVLLTAKGADALLKTVVSNSGTIQARTINIQNGVIKLLGGMDQGQVEVAGTLDASAPESGNGGSVETSGHQVKVADGSKVTTRAASGITGHWLIDPADYTVAASGGDISGATLSSILNNSNVTLMSSAGTHSGTAGNGDININDAVEAVEKPFSSPVFGQKMAQVSLRHFAFSCR